MKSIDTVIRGNILLIFVKQKLFSKGRQPKYVFSYNGLPIEIVKEFNYLGVIFSRTGSFFKAKNGYVSKHRNQCTEL